MRVGLLIYGSLDTMSGGYLYDRMLARALQQRGDTVEVISLPWRNYVSHLIDNFRPDVWRRLQLLDVDALLQDELNHPSLFRVNQGLRRRRYPIISIVHHLRCSEQRAAWLNAWQCRIERLYLRSVDGFVFNSQTTAASVRRLLGADHAGSQSGENLPASLQWSVVAYPAGDRLCNALTSALTSALTDEDIVARAKRTEPLAIIFVGNLIPRKNLSLLLDALAHLPRGAWRLDVVGNTNVDPAYTARIRRQIERLGLSEAVCLTGPLSDAALAERLGSSHVLAAPSSYEGFGIVYLEGMGFGLPAIASTSGAAGEIISDGQNGFLVPPDNVEALAQRLGMMCTDRDALARMSLAARRRYLAHPTWQDSMARACQLLDQIAQRWPAISPKPGLHDRHD